MARIVVAGAGFAGCAAAAAARRAGAHVTLLEKLEVLGGWGLWAGRVDVKYFTVREEFRAMGDDFIFKVLDECNRHKEVFFPFPRPGATKDLYDTTKLDPSLRRYLTHLGVEIRLQARVKDVVAHKSRITAVLLDDGSIIEGDSFVDATGGAGGIGNCTKYGNGCVVCFMRCPAFGNRVSLAGKAGIKEEKGKRRDGSIGPMTAAYSLLKESLDDELMANLERDGVAVIPIPKDYISYDRTESITASGNIDADFAENVCLCDIGAGAKRIAGGYTPLEELRQIPGFSRAIYAEPLAGTLGNGVRYMAVTPRDNALAVPGVDNLLVAGEKLGINSIGECISTGIIAGHNAVRKVVNLEPLVMPVSMMLGDFVEYVNDRWNTEDGLRSRIHIFANPYFSHAEEAGLYTEERKTVRSRVKNANLIDVLIQELVRD
jgi:hypothetical protein